LQRGTGRLSTTQLDLVYEPRRALEANELISLGPVATKKIAP